MISTPDTGELRRLRVFLDESGYDAERLTERLGSAAPPRPEELPRALHRTREANAPNALARLFLIGTSLDEALAAEVFPTEFVETCRDVGLLVSSDGRVRASAVIVPVGDLLLASDAFAMLGSEDARDFVLPASTHSANYLRRVTLREDVGRMLDLGCGCGIHALLAAGHSETVVATDISGAAIRYTEFNAALNGIGNVECRAGDLFMPVADERFDLIVCNPPFVPAPGEEFTYRDNPFELDEFCRRIAQTAPEHLSDGGCMQMLCESVEIEGEDWHARIRAWVDGTGCDAWLLHGLPIAPADYVARRSRDVVGAQSAPADSYERWLSYLHERGVVAVHPGMLVMRRRQARNWLHVHNLAADVDRDAGDAVRRGIAACDYLERVAADEALLGETLAIAAQLTLDQKFRRADAAWRPERSILRMDDGLAMDAEVDIPIMAFLNQLDGSSTLGVCIDQFAAAVGADCAKLKADLLPVVRQLLGRGFLVTAAGN
jgi:SAM-dependent methyltransferase